MYWLDTTLLAILGLGAGLGFLSGFLWQIARIFSLAASLVATISLNAPTADFLNEHLLRGAQPRVVHTVAYVLVFVAVYLACYACTRLVHSWIRATELEVIDRFLGAAFGAGKAALVLGIVCLAAANYPHATTKDWLAKSTLAPVFADGMEHVLVLIPEDYKDSLRATLLSLRELLTRHPSEQRPQPETPAGDDWVKTASTGAGA